MIQETAAKCLEYKIIVLVAKRTVRDQRYENSGRLLYEGAWLLPQAVEEYSSSNDPNRPPVCTNPPFPNCGAQFADFHPPMDSPTAHGINTKGDVVGTYINIRRNRELEVHGPS